MTCYVIWAATVWVPCTPGMNEGTVLQPHATSPEDSSMVLKAESGPGIPRGLPPPYSGESPTELGAAAATLEINQDD